jgi:hypothetical protein
MSFCNYFDLKILRVCILKINILLKGETIMPKKTVPANNDAQNNAFQNVAQAVNRTEQVLEKLQRFPIGKWIEQTSKSLLGLADSQEVIALDLMGKTLAEVNTMGLRTGNQKFGVKNIDNLAEVSLRDATLKINSQDSFTLLLHNDRVVGVQRGVPGQSGDSTPNK